MSEPLSDIWPETNPPVPIDDFIWIEKARCHDDPDCYGNSYLVDKDGRCLAVVQHPLSCGMLYRCSVLLNGTEERFYIDLPIAKEYCMEVAKMHAAATEAMVRRIQTGVRRRIRKEAAK
jgi:hypothetical protein